jgi:hypothetical protein
MTDAVFSARALTLIDPDPQDPTWAWFCGHCGAAPEDPPDSGFRRVCSECTLGVLLRARADAAPERDGAFVVVDASLAVQAVSRQAETLLGQREQFAVNRHITELLIPPDAEDAPVGLARAITRAATGDEEPTDVFVRPSATFGVRLRVRIAACGPPQAALLVLA